MTEKEVLRIRAAKGVPHPTDTLSLISTHISWVLLGEAHVYKIKKPVTLSFLDFSTPELRRKYCGLEVTLNRRLAPSMYLGVLPVRRANNRIFIGDDPGEIIDHAVHMKRMDESRQLDILLEKGAVEANGIIRLAKVIADFHQTALRVADVEDWEELYQEFADILSMKHLLQARFGKETGELLEAAVTWSSEFLYGLRSRIEERNREGFVIEGHGDLHCRNIFLLETPVIFDCIEFNDDFRKLDMLNEVAFLCMDLERFGRADLAHLFCEHYFTRIPCMSGKQDEQLFLFYKMHRANVRIKVHAIGISGAGLSESAKQAELQQLQSYLRLFRQYFARLIKQ